MKEITYENERESRFAIEPKNENDINNEHKDNNMSAGKKGTSIGIKNTGAAEKATSIIAKSQSVSIRGGNSYFKTRKEAESVRQKGDRIYYSDSEKAYYIRHVSKPFWGW
jgi:uncharacterized secreted protein with C-terminal beta-propeller domain